MSKSESTEDVRAAYEAPGAVMAEAIAAARALARMIADAEAVIDPRLCGVARTVARMSQDGRIADPMYAGPLAGLIEGLERAIAAATRVEVRTVERGWDENGPTYDVERVLVIDAAAAPLAPVRDQARAVAERLERVGDILAADAAIAALRERQRR